MIQPNNKGFTLIEMLVALSIFASLMGVLMLGYSQGLSLWERGQQQSSQWQAMEYRYGLLEDLFIRAQVSDYIRVGGAFVPYYHGDRDSQRFISRSPILDFPGRVRPVELTIERQSDQSYNLVYREAARYSDPGRGIDWASANEQLLLQGIRDAYFEYEAQAFPLPPDIDPLYLAANEKIRYRSQPEWLSAFNSDWMWRVPQTVRFNFTDSEDRQHQWTFPLSSSSDAWSLEVYSTD